jgi:hypothetical protein
MQKWALKNAIIRAMKNAHGGEFVDVTLLDLYVDTNISEKHLQMETDCFYCNITIRYTPTIGTYKIAHTFNFTPQDSSQYA